MDIGKIVGTVYKGLVKFAEKMSEQAEKSVDKFDKDVDRKVKGLSKDQLKQLQKKYSEKPSDERNRGENIVLSHVESELKKKR
ncbi:hypothetical protein [Weissella confusa]|uniref:hypothetical protein n=1 Tax=Weissella confusa TaxID=1583 RepID=UPI0021A47B90|nr:hypothetical protein [Weissella confusa]MCT2910895.1 hypothetical protein [Weissella confusa]